MKVLAVIFGLFISGMTFAQGIDVHGVVLDGAFEKEPLAFASVRVKDLDINVETRLDGTFKFNLLEGKYTFVVEFTGYAPFEIEEVVVSKSDVILNPIILSSLKRTYDLASTSNE